MTSNTLPSLALARAFPSLAALPCLALADLPTPVLDATAALGEPGAASLHIKCDNATHPRHGGNKIRKLAFLLAQARLQGSRSVLTFGAAGSNHALATALCAAELGMNTLAVLGPQHNSAHVRENLLAYDPGKAVLIPCEWRETEVTAAKAFHDAWRRDGVPPFVIPAGGSSPLGALGYVNAAFELREQIRAGLLPEPDLIYVASGTMGTCVGLALGLLAAGLKARIQAVRVTVAPYTSLERAQSLFQGIVGLLRGHDPNFPSLVFSDAPMTLRDDYFGKDYALFTNEGMAAVQTAREHLGMDLEGVYTGKAFAALLGDAAAGGLDGKWALFWNTYAGDRHATAPAADPDGWKRLPEALWRYFIEPVQPLDKTVA